MDKKKKIISYSELVNLNEEGEVDGKYLHFEVFKNNGKYFGTIVKINNDKIIIDTSVVCKNNIKKMAVG